MIPSKNFTSTMLLLAELLSYEESVDFSISSHPEVTEQMQVFITRTKNLLLACLQETQPIVQEMKLSITTDFPITHIIGILNQMDSSRTNQNFHEMSFKMSLADLDHRLSFVEKKLAKCDLVRPIADNIYLNQNLQKQPTDHSENKKHKL